MWSGSCTDPLAPPPPEEERAEEGETARLSREFLASLRPQPGCEKDGVCNQCGLCEH